MNPEVADREKLWSSSISSCTTMSFSLCWVLRGPKIQNIQHGDSGTGCIHHGSAMYKKHEATRKNGGYLENFAIHDFHIVSLIFPFFLGCWATCASAKPGGKFIAAVNNEGLSPMGFTFGQVHEYQHKRVIVHLYLT